MPSTSLPAARPDQRLNAGVISHLLLFAGLGPDDIATMAQAVWGLRAARGELIVRRQARLPGVCAVVYGGVKLALRGPDGVERVLQLVSAGQTFGEANALLAHAADYDAVAVAECKLLVLPTAALLDLAERRPRFARNLMMLLARRSVELVAELEAATLHRTSRRLAAYLQSLSQVDGAPGDGAPGPARIHLPQTKTMIASRLGVKKETLSRLLRRLAADGVIEVARREIAILDRERLAALAAR